MTLRELWMLVVRYWAIVVIAAVIGGLLAFGYSVVKDSADSYRAEAYVVVGSGLNSVAGLAENASRDMQSDFEAAGVSVSVSSNSSVMTVEVTAEGPNPQACIEAANLVANAANETATEAYAQDENPYRGEVSPANEASLLKTTEKELKFLALGFVGGVVVALLVIVLIDLRSRYVKTPETVQEVTNLPVLEKLPAATGEKLLANVRFAASRLGVAGPELSVLVIPVGREYDADETAALLTTAAALEGFEGMSVSSAPPLSESMSGAYASTEADIVVIVVRQWRDSLPALVACVDELRFAESRVAGLVFVGLAGHRS